MTDKSLKLLIGFESLPKENPLEAYWDSHGKVWTIGYGNTYWPDGTPVKKGDKLKSTDEAVEMLKLIVPKYENLVKSALGNSVYNSLTDNQKDALTSLTYNIGSGNFKKSTVCRLVKTNKNDHAIKDAFMMWNKSGGEVLKGLVTRRAKESAFYFNEPVEIPDVVVKTSTTPTKEVVKQKTQIYDYTYGNGNMFYELSHSSDWVVTKFKKIPRKANNWQTMLTGTTVPKVGDLLFAYHDAKTKGTHDHVAIYLGIHGGHIYVAEGISVSGVEIYENNKKVHIARIEDSRLAYETDIITHFAHCLKAEIKQVANDTPSEEGSVGVDSKNRKNGYDIKIDYNIQPAIGEDKMKHFTLVDTRRGAKSSLTYSDTAHSKGIQNTITNEARQNLVNLVNYLLDPLYEAVLSQGIGKIFVSSGYRNEELNKKIGGAEKSQHKSGQAVDIQVKDYSGGSPGNALLKIAQMVLRMEESGQISYDQMILEKFNSPADRIAFHPVWIHISFISKEANRKYSNGTKLMIWDSNTGKYIHVTKEEVLSKPID